MYRTRPRLPPAPTPHPSQMTKLFLILLLFAVSTAALPAQATYLHLDGGTIPGSPAAHLDELPITSFESSVNNPTLNPTSPTATSTVYAGGKIMLKSCTLRPRAVQ